MPADIIKRLETASQDSLAYPFTVEPLPGPGQVYRVLIEDQPEFPIALSEAEGELLCMVRLFGTDEIRPERKGELFETMLAGNLSLPLSSFGLANGAVYLYGSLSSSSKTEVVMEEIQTLAGNTLEALDLVKDYLA